VSQELPHRHITLARLREFRPIIGDPGVIRDESAGHRDCHDQGGDPLGRGEHVDHRVRSPRILGQSVSVATPEVDDPDAVTVDGDGRADFCAVAKIGAKGVGNLSIAGLHVAMDQIRRHYSFEF